MKRAFVCVCLGGILLIASWLLQRTHSTRPTPAPAASEPAAAAPALVQNMPTPPVVLPPGALTATSPAQPSTPPSPPQPTPPASGPFAEFANWVERRLAGDTAAGRHSGEALAWKRRAAMLELIETDPEQAIRMAVPFHWRTALPENVTRHFETWVDGRGTLTVAMASGSARSQPFVYREVELNGKRYTAFVYGWREKQVSQSGIPLHGIALENKMAVLADPLRRLTADESDARLRERPQPIADTCAVCGRTVNHRAGVIADIGGDLALFCSPDHAEMANTGLITAQSGGPNAMAKLSSTPANDRWTHGPKTLLYLRANFPDDLTEPISEQNAYLVMNEANDFYTENSFNLTSLTTTVAPLVTLPQSKAWYGTAGPGALLADARDAARRVGYDTANFDLDIVAFTAIEEYDWAGLGAVHGKSVWLQSQSVGVTCHELGHNYGLGHANFWDATTNHSGIGYGTNMEYGNLFDLMGSGGGHFGAAFKTMLGWIPDTAVQDAAVSGLYRVYQFDTPERVEGRHYAAHARKDSTRDYWIDLRQETDNDWLLHGVLVNWVPDGANTQMIDTTPGTPSDPLSRRDAAAVIGRTFTDPGAGVHITPVAQGGTGLETWIDVQVNLGFFPDNHPPRLKLEVESTNTSPNSLVHFRAVASDPDGDPLAYAWTFDQLAFSTNNLPWIARRWSSPGEYIVRCTVSDMKGGVASANTVVTVGQTNGFRISGRVTDLDGNGLQGVRVDNSAASLEALIYCYTDSSGQYVLVGVTNEFPILQALQYGYTFTNTGWANPLWLTGNTNNADFIGVPLPRLTLTAATNVIAENGMTETTLTLTRTGGDLSNALPVALTLQGSASVSGDYTLNPTLDRGTNTIEIPAEASEVTFTVSTINDSLVEGFETIELTIDEDLFYMVAPPGQAVLQLEDNDAPVKPAVSVSTITPTVPENGMDNGAFQFSRTGGTQGDLPVYYAAGGSAAPGVDYTALVGTAVIPAGSSSVTIPFAPVDDKNVETNETLVLTISPNPAYTLGTPEATATIFDDDLLTVTIAATAGAAEQGASGRFTIKRDGDLSGNLEVQYEAGGTAIPALDYQALSGSVVIPAGAASAEVFILPLDDAFLEGDESVTLTLRTNSLCSIGTPGSATLFITDSEATTVSVFATDNAASEQGDDIGILSVSRGPVTAGNLMVNLAISGTATAGVDYVPLDNPVTIPDGRSSVTLEVIAFHDLYLEPTETVQVNIAPGTNYSIGFARQATVEIADDAATAIPAVGFTFAAAAFEERFSPGVSVSLSTTSTEPVSVEYRLLGGTATPADFSFTPGVLEFAPGERAKSIPLTINNDSSPEPNETIRLVLVNPLAATLDGIKVHTYTIVDDDTASLTVTSTVPAASETGPVPGNFRITRTGNTNQTLVVNFHLDGSASAPADYAPPGSAITLPGGVAAVDVPVVPVDDNVAEQAETVVLTLATAPGAVIAWPNHATVTISDNDSNTLPLVRVAAAQPYAVEGGGQGEFVFTRTGPTNNPLLLSFTAGGSASSGVDFDELGEEITIPAGQASAHVLVTPLEDTLVEGEETVVLSLTARELYCPEYPGSATVILQDNDQLVSVDASDFTAAEPGTDTGELTFTRFGTTNTGVQVFFTLSGTAQNGLDYRPLSNSVVIPAGSLSMALPLAPLDDLLVEGPEKVILTLAPNAAYDLGATTEATITINDDEPMVSVAADVESIVEGNRPPAAFIVTRTGDPEYDFTAYLAVGGTAAFGVDYPPFATNVYFSCEIMTVRLEVAPTNELQLEADESVTVELLPHPDYTILSPSNAVILIKDAGANQNPLVTITSPTTNLVFIPATNANMILEAAVNDDDDTNQWTLAWTRVRGPNSLSFGDSNAANSTVTFSNAGVYVLRLTLDDGVLLGYDEVWAVVGPVELASSNLLHWALDEGAGTNVLDSSGAGRHGVFSGEPLWLTNGVLGGALSFSGTNDCVQATNSGPWLDGLDAFTVSLWVKPAETNSSRGILCAGDSGTNQTLGISLQADSSCGRFTNVIEVTFPTTEGLAHYVSASDRLTGQWQHLLVTWSNGLAPVLFIDGKPDQPDSTGVPVPGALTNCPGFILGADPLRTPVFWKGSIDDVRVFPRYLTAEEVYAVAGLPPANYAPVVEVETNLTVQLVNPVELTGVVLDDGKPIPPGTLSNGWSMISGPAEPTLADPGSVTTTATFVQAGDYVFRLTADDGQVRIFDDLPVTVIEPTHVYIYPSDPDAAELGPDPGQITLLRDGDLNFELAVQLAAGGFASNGLDFVELPSFEQVTFPLGSNTVVFDIIPFVDHRIEGDEPFTLTIVSNLAYTILAGEATVTVHDSPYGVWSVERFTLEELTDPVLSGEAADFDHDKLVNFAEYAFNLDPKSPETNSPVAVTLEVHPGDGQRHITLRYTRRIAPTDADSAPYVSSDLLTWHTGPEYFQELEVVDDGNNLTETVTSQLVAPYSMTTSTFVTVRVWLKATGP